MTIDLDLSSDQRQVMASIQDVLSDRFPLSRLRDGSGPDNARLGELAELGWLGLGVEEEHGGSGFTFVEDVLLFREMGRHLVTPGMLASVLAHRLAIALGDTTTASDIIAGRTAACLAVERVKAGRSTEGQEYFVYDADDARLALFWDSSRIGYLPVEAGSERLSRRCVDKSVSLQLASLASTNARYLQADAAQRLRRRADLLVAAQLLGIAEASLDLAVDYAKLRQQFGQPIGSFQAIKHRCADMKVRATVLASQVLIAALSELEMRSDADLQIAAARLLAPRYAIDNAAAGIQIHGAMGFTAECDAHLFLLRAHLLENIGSTALLSESEMGSLPLPGF